jgi:hypothetical protein
VADTPATPAWPGRALSLGTLLADACEGVVQAQRRLDSDALERAARFVETPQGAIALPPLWYTFSDVQLQLELASVVAQVGTTGSFGLACQVLNPASVSLFGYAAASGLRVSVRLAPREAVPAPPGPPA